MLRCDDVIVAVEKSVAEKFDDFVGTVAEDDVVRRDLQLRSQSLTEIETAAVRIKLRPLQSIAHGSESFWCWPERIFIRSELDDVAWVDLELARGFFDRLCWSVRGHMR